MDYLEIRELYHADLMEKEKARIISEFEIFNTDFLDDLPYQVRNVLDSLKWRFRTEDWFPEAWEKYRQHVLEAGLGGEIKMPGYIFNPYLERYVDEHFRESNNNLGECRYSDMEIGEYLAHHGIKGQKWGIRRFQNKDGSFTEEGKKRYGINSKGVMSKEGMAQYDKDRKIDKTKKVVGITAAVAAGTAIVGGLLVAHHTKKASAATTAYDLASQKVTDLDNKYGRARRAVYNNSNPFKTKELKAQRSAARLAWQNAVNEKDAAYEVWDKATDNHLAAALAAVGMFSTGTLTAAKVSNKTLDNKIRKDKENYLNDIARNK